MRSPAQHTKMAKPHHVFAAFVSATRDYWENEHGYKFKTTPGVKSIVYPLVRDKVIPQGLRIARAQRMGVPVSSVPAVEVQYKTAAEARRSDHRVSPRAILGWEWSPTPEPPSPQPPGARLNTHIRFDDDSTAAGDAERRVARKAERRAARKAERRAARKAEEQRAAKAQRRAVRKKAERVAARRAAREERRAGRAAEVDADLCPPFELDEDVIQPDYTQLAFDAQQARIAANKRRAEAIRASKCKLVARWKYNPTLPLTPDDTIRIVPEPTNEYDANALMVFAHVDEWLHVGYIDRESAARVHDGGFTITGARIVASAADSLPVQLDLE
jgi:hypothetical protein